MDMDHQIALAEHRAEYEFAEVLSQAQYKPISADIISLVGERERKEKGDEASSS